MTKAEQYSKDVLSGKIVASNFVKQACKRFEGFLKDPEIEYDIERAEYVVNWFETKLNYWEGEWRGKPFKLEPWQCFGIQQIFGLKKNGRRLITRVYWEIARKNAKTTTAAGIALYHLFADTEATPQILIGANNHDQAKICTTCAGKLLENSPVFKPYLDDELRIYKYGPDVNSIVFKPKDAKIISMTKEVKTKDGFNPSMGIIDEYHEATEDSLLEVIRSGQGARKEPLLIVITTAGFNKNGPCYSQLRKTGLEVLDGRKEDDSQLILIYEPDVDDKWTDEKAWLKSNPNFNVSVFSHYLEDRFNEAKNEGASKEVKFKTKNLNIWTDASIVWITDAVWMENSGAVETDMAFHSGLDIAYKQDWSAWVLVGRKNDEYHIIPYFWIPEDTVPDKEKNEHSNIRQWIKDGLVMTTPGSVTDHNAIIEFILEKRKELNIKSCYSDPAYAISIITKLQESGLDSYEMLQTGGKLTPMINKLYEVVKQGKVRHGGNPVLRWMMGNAMLKEKTIQTSNNLKFLVKESEHNKIDGVDAMINALHPYVYEEEEKPLFIGWA